MSDHTDELDLSRAERAARDYLAGEAGAAGFSPLDPEALKPVRPTRRGLGAVATVFWAVRAPELLGPSRRCSTEERSGGDEEGRGEFFMLRPPRCPHRRRAGRRHGWCRPGAAA